MLVPVFCVWVIAELHRFYFGYKGNIKEMVNIKIGIDDQIRGITNVCDREIQQVAIAAATLGVGRAMRQIKRTSSAWHQRVGNSCRQEYSTDALTGKHQIKI